MREKARAYIVKRAASLIRRAPVVFLAFLALHLSACRRSDQGRERVIYVSPEGDDAGAARSSRVSFRTVQAAVDAVPNADDSPPTTTIILAQGVYREKVMIHNKTRLKLIGAGPRKSVIRHDLLGARPPVVHIEKSSHIRIEGIGAVNEADDPADPGVGRGYALSWEIGDQDHPENAVRYLEMENCYGYGNQDGGVYVRGGCRDITISNSEFVGGGHMMAHDDCSVIYRHCIIRNKANLNLSSTVYVAMFSPNSPHTVTLENCKIYHAGMMAIGPTEFVQDDPTLRFVDCEIIDMSSGLNSNNMLVWQDKGFTEFLRCTIRRSGDSRSSFYRTAKDRGPSGRLRIVGCTITGYPRLKFRYGPLNIETDGAIPATWIGRPLPR